ncbi:hypothetical protein EDB81DRAFT_866270 [Dactylonectria macrodidyma]|uniref:Nephrocystin 3-like N-terminal domain-containing protein n=1 Tax=Dactylonectria macrodidyma TaxID=307937 RepID=A0A9P9FQ82_9HYPO|nr:hypothetical protein EDB81DRAFT_866270 [Dactylonectria macrodidyma]
MVINQHYSFGPLILHACLKPLSFRNFNACLYDIALAHPHTLLWVKGKPGAGKSTLMKHTLRYCQPAHDSFKGYNIASFFFNARGANLEKTLLGMLRSLMPSLRSNLIILIDALDECQDPDVRDMVGFIEELSIRAVGARGTLKICLFSRHYPTITIKKHQELVVEGIREHQEDIHKYVSEKLNERNEEIEKELFKKASGVFMWVVLVVSMLNTAFDEGKVDAMWKSLNQIPRDLEDLLGNILQLYFAMMSGAETGQLKPWDPSKISAESIRRRITYSSRGLMEIRKVQAYREQGASPETVHFIHESVNDFLLRNRLQELDPALASNPAAISHDRLARCCLSCLMMETLPPPEAERRRTTYWPSHPFLGYASTYALDHAEEAEAETLERIRLYHCCLLSRGLECANSLYMSVAHQHSGLVKALLGRGVNVNGRGAYGTVLQAAIYTDNQDTMALLLEKGADVNGHVGFQATPLQLAASFGRNEMVSTLPKNGADIDARQEITGTALQEASHQGNRAMVRMLLEKGADVNVRSFRGMKLFVLREISLEDFL